MGPESEDQKEYFCCFAEPGADPLTVKMDLMQLLPLEDGWFKRLAQRFKASRTESLRQLETTRYSWQDVRFTSPLFSNLYTTMPVRKAPNKRRLTRATQSIHVARLLQGVSHARDGKCTEWGR
ncbi:hypothetical protein N7530_000118 [Penicillium desertorum]|uniref:Uncharacterized protein n=1 Tax=Penicillium desertorum TaxID=1303715 RepID=A0A9X0BV21_9EURO|nr:hypothetical protein N7530_000118 [Penicillium desertorum]